MATRRLKGSERSALPNARAIGPADQHERLEVSVIVRPQARDVLEERISRLVRADRLPRCRARISLRRMGQVPRIWPR
jgi:hypothetical protein